jgi:D-alanyl-D-alanine carboxypeptidase (penicillin-binding protein 5/6)
MGLASTHFSNFDGLPVPTQSAPYSTPADLIRLGEQAMRQPVFQRIVAQRSHRLVATSRHHPYLWRSTNLLLGSYRGAIGIKTGTTPAAGNCLLFAARRGARTLIGVVLHANPASQESSRFTAARRMLNWGFRHA